VTDNASDHSVQKNRAPDFGMKNYVMKEWSCEWQIPLSDDVRKVELWDIIE
jgi:hypothetical protein